MAILYTNDTAGKQAETRDRIVTSSNRALIMMKNIVQGNFNLIFANVKGLTAQQASDSLGTSAGALFTFNNQMATFIAARDASYIAPSPGALTPAKTVTINGDGTVTIT